MHPSYPSLAPDFTISLPRSSFFDTFDLIESDGPSCPITMNLVDSLSSNPGSPVFYMTAADGDPTEVIFEPTSNTQIGTSTTLGGTSIDCQLYHANPTLANQECTFSYNLQVNSVNGTVAIQASGSVLVRSECFTIAEFQGDNNSIWI